jgi:hypothetical protein
MLNPRIDDNKRKFLQTMQAVYGEIDVITKSQITILVEKHGSPDPTWLCNTKKYRLSRGVYKIPTELLNTIRGETMSMNLVNGAAHSDAIEDAGNNTFKNEEILFDWNYRVVVPDEDPIFVPFGHFEDVETITKSGEFFPYWIYGHSGIGKTFSIEQSHARLHKQLIMTPITREADEDSLLGGLRLENGNTVPFFGPISMAALMGVTVCLDETDLGDEKLMCLQTSLTGKPFLIKRLGKVVTPKPGFNVCATANTQGKGNTTGKFIGTNPMNDAMLDRYFNFFEQDFPSVAVERKILVKVLGSIGLTSEKEAEFIERLLEWANIVRTNFKQNICDEVISTRRLVHICKSYNMYGKNRMKAIRLSIGRFDQTVQSSFLDVYKCVDADWNAKAEKERYVKASIESGLDPEIPF